MDAVALQHSEWVAEVDHRFTHSTAGELVLAEVSRLLSAGGNDSFSLLFQTSDPNVLEQGVQALTLPDGRVVTLFLVPISEHSLEAVFSTPTPGATPHDNDESSR